MTPDFTVRNRGVDTDGRAILATDYMWDWWQRVIGELGWEPTIVQGAFMNRVPGGGAVASVGYHDSGGCFDLRTRDLTPAKIDQLVRTLRRMGAAAWRRDQQHGGMDPHCHFVLGTDRPLSSGAYIQWNAYQIGKDGLKGNGSDYEWRPTPLVTTPPEADVTPAQQAQLDRIEAKLDDLDKVLRRITKAKREVIDAVEADE